MKKLETHLRLKLDIVIRLPRPVARLKVAFPARSTWPTTAGAAALYSLGIMRGTFEKSPTACSIGLFTPKPKPRKKGCRDDER